MSQLIKSTSVYTAHLPVAENLEGAISESAWTPIEINSTQLSAHGFSAFDSGQFVRQFPGGLAFRFTLEDKIIPGKVIKDELRKRVEAVRADTGRKAGKKEKREIRENVVDDLARQAFTSVETVEAYYNPETKWLVIPSTKRKLCDKLVSALVFACESVKTETIHVSDVAMGLTTRLTQWLEGEEEAFGVFDPCGTVELAQDDRRLRVKMASLSQAEEGLRTALRQGFRVKTMALRHGGKTEFSLTEDLKAKGLIFVTQPEPSDEQEDAWTPQIAVEFADTCDVISDLIDMFSKETTDEAAAENV